MDLPPIRDDAGYRATLKEVESLMMAKLGTPEGERLEALATLVEVWEREHYPMELPDPVGAQACV